jgi:hypothetical protein
MEDVAAILVWVLVNAGIGGALGKLRNQVANGAMLSVVLGPVGWIGVFCLPDLRPTCPECLGVVILGATRCRHCGIEIRIVESDEGAA